MNPDKIDLETPHQFYIKLKDRKNLTDPEIKQLIKFVNEVKYIVEFGKLGKQGHKSAVYIYEKLLKLESKHRIKKEVRTVQGLFSNV